MLDEILKKLGEEDSKYLLDLIKDKDKKLEDGNKQLESLASILLEQKDKNKDIDSVKNENETLVKKLQEFETSTKSLTDKISQLEVDNRKKEVNNILSKKNIALPSTYLNSIDVNADKIEEEVERVVNLYRSENKVTIGATPNNSSTEIDKEVEVQNAFKELFGC